MVMHALMRIGSSLRALLVGAIAAILLTGGGTAQAANVTFNLRAKTGTTTLPGGAVADVWGYCQVPGPATDCAPLTAPGGPTLIVNQGDVVTVTLANALPEPSAMVFQGQAMVPDTAGAAVNGTRSYTFTAAAPGTFLYEAGLRPNAQHQVALGLYGALVVRPATATQAYAPLATAFDD
jgi:FtsP/CotA-like multicopper oxidase with cupredoxin domain